MNIKNQIKNEQEEEELEQELLVIVPAIDKAFIKSLAVDGDKYIHDEIEHVKRSIDLFLNSKFESAIEFLKEKYCKTLLFTVGYATLESLKSIMTFDQDDLKEALKGLENVIQLSTILKKDQSIISSFAGMFFNKNSKDGSNLKTMTKLERHAELTFAEAYLLKALISILTDSNMIAFVREGIKMRTAYNTYKSFYRFLRNIHREHGNQGFQKFNIDEHFISGVLYGIGVFNLIFSMLPAKVLRVFEMIGFSGNRQFALSALEKGARWKVTDRSEMYPPPKKNTPLDKISVQFDMPGSPKSAALRSFLCDLTLLSYHIIFSSMIQLPDADIPMASHVLDEKLKLYPESFLFLLFKARLYMSQCNPQAAEKELKFVIEKQKDWRSFVHVCIFDLGICRAIQGKWEEAVECFDTLIKESNWSTAVYSYFKAVFLYEADPIKYQSTILELMQTIPKLTKKIAGKSIPLEKFVTRKARKFLNQNNRLLLPGYEIIFVWSGFDVFAAESFPFILSRLDFHIKDLDAKLEAMPMTKNGHEKPYSSFYDDACLARFFKGVVTREVAFPTSSTLLPGNELVKIKCTEAQKTSLTYASRQLELIVLEADFIEFDHWILPFARFEQGQLHMRLGDYTRARREFKAAANGGYAENEDGIPRKRVSMESALHFRVHNAIVKLDIMEKLLGREVENTEEVAPDSDNE